MMNIKQNKGLFALLLLAVLTACTSEDNITTSKQLIEVGGDKLKIVINEEPFDVETTTQTRAGGMEQSIPAGTVDLGDGLEAEVSISQGTPAPKTRATVVSDGHYNIYAYDANTNQMLIGPNKKLSGNVVGGVFTPDAGSRLELEVGTYKFVCCTDGVGLDQTYGTGDAGFWYRTQLDMIGATEQTISGDDQQIVFLMYHRAARFRFRLTGYTNQLTDVKAQFGLGMRGCHHGYITIPTGFSGPSTAIGDGYYAKEQAIHATPAQQSTTYPLANEFLSDYTYLTCDGGLGVIWLNLSGTIYGKPVNIQDKRLELVHGATLKDNGSYTINLKLKPTPALYLFEDGTCGALAEKGSRKVIGVVAKEKTNSEDGTAAAISHVKGGTATYIFGTNTTTLDNQRQYNDADSRKAFREASETDDGYNNTWGVSHDGVTIKANEQTRYPAFYAAAHYDEELAAQGITLTGNMVGRKWFLPSVKEWVQLFNTTIPSAGLGAVLFDFGQAMTAAGGTYKGGYSHLVTSSEWDAAQYLELYASTGKGPFNMWSTPKNADYNQPVLPFIHF
ncbi:MAG: hypothetical protein ACFNOO_08255 [Segatella oulorum]